jgi:hypothetical protein
MKAEDFRKIALSMAEASESAHMGHPDFRVGGRIFATLGYPDERFGVVVLPAQEQENLVQSYSGVFTPANGAWGDRGATLVLLKKVGATILRKAIAAAWQRRAPKRLLAFDQTRQRTTGPRKKQKGEIKK